MTDFEKLNVIRKILEIFWELPTDKDGFCRGILTSINAVLDMENEKHD